jgi:hypothetical protein
VPVHLARVGRRDRSPGVPGDLEYHQSDDQADDRVTAREAKGDDDRARNDGERDESIDAGVVAVGDEGGTRKTPSRSQPHLRGDLVADKADRPSGGEHRQVGELLWVDEALDRLVERNAGRDEDREDDEESCHLLGSEAAQGKGNGQRYRGQCVTEVVNQVGQQRDRVGEDEDQSLGGGGQSEDAEAPGDCL